jgi:hypothetical protein
MKRPFWSYLGIIGLCLAAPTLASPLQFVINGIGSGIIYPSGPTVGTMTTFSNQPFEISVTNTQGIQTGFGGTVAPANFGFVEVGAMTGVLTTGASLGIDTPPGGGEVDLYFGVPAQVVLSMASTALNGWNIGQAIGPVSVNALYDAPQHIIYGVMPFSDTGAVYFSSVSNVTFQAIVVSPEPKSLALWVLGFALLLIVAVGRGGLKKIEPRDAP